MKVKRVKYQENSESEVMKSHGRQGRTSREICGERYAALSLYTDPSLSFSELLFVNSLDWRSSSNDRFSIIMSR